MKLDVLSTDEKSEPWYADGLRFTCSQCGNCCTGGPGFVWLTKDEIAKIADHLRITPGEMVERYCRKVGEKFSLIESVNKGQHDCIFLVDMPQSRGAGDKVVQTKRGCRIYPVRPLQCRTWPFWPENLSNEKTWNLAARKCHGMNTGRTFKIKQIHAIRDASDWPRNPPTSATTTKE
jgi:Fe-S-cluster containining protein